MGSFWYKLKDKFGDRVQLIYTDTDSLVFSLDGKTYKEANLLSYIEAEPEFAEDFDLTDIPDVPKTTTYNQSILVNEKQESDDEVQVRSSEYR